MPKGFFDFPSGGKKYAGYDEGEEKLDMEYNPESHITRLIISDAVAGGSHRQVQGLSPESCSNWR